MAFAPALVACEPKKSEGPGAFGYAALDPPFPLVALPTPFGRRNLGARYKSLLLQGVGLQGSMKGNEVLARRPRSGRVMGREWEGGCRRRA